MYSRLYGTARQLWPGGRKIRMHIKELRRRERLSPSDRRAWQLAEIQAIVKHAYSRIPYYRERYDQCGIGPEDIQSFEDFQALPILRREDVRDNLHRLVWEQSPLRPQTRQTGGSTGETVRFFIDASFWWWNVALEQKARSQYGIMGFPKIAWFWGAWQELPDRSLNQRARAMLMRHRFLNAFNLTEEKMGEFAAMLVRWKPDMFRAYTSAVTLFARYLRENGIGDIQPSLIETTAEKLTQPDRELLETTFNCPVADCYSSREFNTIAYECGAGGLHVCEGRYVEVVNGSSPTPKGTLGTILVTSTNQYTMPFIRYEIGDLGIEAEHQCPCGQDSRVLQDVVGRKLEYVVTQDGRLIHGTFFAALFSHFPQTVQYQVFQPELGRLEVRLVACDPGSDGWLKPLEKQIHKHLGPNTDIEVKMVDRFELSPAGKHRPIISKVARETCWVGAGQDTTNSG